MAERLTLEQRDRLDGTLVDSWPTDSKEFLKVTRRLRSYCAGRAPLGKFRHMLLDGQEFRTAGFVYRVQPVE